MNAMAPYAPGLDTLDIAEVLDVALRIQLHKLQVRFHLRLQCSAPLEAGVDHYLEVAQIEVEPWEQAVHGAVWGARRLRDDAIVQIAFEQHAHGELITFPRLAQLFDRQLAATSQTHLGFILEPGDARAGIALDRYLPAPPGGPLPFWIGVAWGTVKYHTLAKLALEARRHGSDILDDWLDFQLSS